MPIYIIVAILPCLMVRNMGGGGGGGGGHTTYLHFIRHDFIRVLAEKDPFMDLDKFSNPLLLLHLPLPTVFLQSGTKEYFK